MRKIKLLLITVLLGCVSVFLLPADDDPGVDLDMLGSQIVPYVQLDLMCASDAFSTESGSVQMQSFSAGLDDYYKEILYSRYGQDPWNIAFTNFFTGGIGSIMNGNLVSGITIQTGVLASYTFMILGFTSTTPEERNTNFLIAQIGGAVFGLAGLVLPFIETAGHNKSLKQALNYEK